MDFADLRRDVQCFSVELAREWYLLGSGQKAEPDLAGLYGRYLHLARPALLERLRAARSCPDESAARRARHLYEFLVGFYESAHVRELEEGIERTRQQLRVPVGDRALPYGHAQQLLAGEPDRARRRELEHQLQEATQTHLNPQLRERVLYSHRLARELGYAHYSACWDDARGLELAQLSRLAGRILAETRTAACAALARDLDRYLGLTLAEAEVHDYAFLSRGRIFDPAFPPEGLMPLLGRVAAGLGLDLQQLPNLRLDLEVRENKSPRAFCATIRVPEEVVLVVMPRGGHDDYHALLHEAGHALHFGHVRPGTAFEFARLGDMAVSELYAFLLQHLLHDPLFLAEQAALPAGMVRDYTRFSRRAKLLLLRRYCAKLRYELQLHQTDDLAPMPDLYQRELRAATFLPYRAAYYLADLDPGFYAAHYLRAWIAEAQLRQVLWRRFGRRWWLSPAAGEFLRALWGRGMQLGLAELLQQAGESALAPEPLLAEVAAGGV